MDHLPPTPLHDSDKAHQVEDQLQELYRQAQESRSLRAEELVLDCRALRRALVGRVSLVLDSVLQVDFLAEAVLGLHHLLASHREDPQALHRLGFSLRRAVEASLLDRAVSAGRMRRMRERLEKTLRHDTTKPWVYFSRRIQGC